MVAEMHMCKETHCEGSGVFTYFIKDRKKE